MSISLDIFGLREFEQRIQKAQRDIQQRVAGEVEAAAMHFVEGAKRDLSAQGGNTGRLLGSIDYRMVSEHEAQVSAPVFYAPFIEFGTKGKYDPYPGTEQFAAEYKGLTRGSGKEFFESIKDWVDKKGIAATYSVKTRKRTKKTRTEEELTEQLAWLIMRSISKKGIAPRPFFFKQISPTRSFLHKNLNRVLDGL